MKTRFGWVVVMAAYLLALSAAACGDAEEREATAYWRLLKDRSVAVSGDFLAAAARDDSVALAENATDSVAVMVSRMRRHAAADALVAAAQQFPAREKNVRAFGTGASVTFSYTFAGHQMRAAVETGYRDNRLVVTDFGTQVWEH